LSGHTYASFRFNIKEGLNLKRVREVDVAASHEVTPSLERHLAAIDFSTSEKKRVIVGTAQLQIGARDQSREIIFYAQGRWDADFDIESEGYGGRRRHGRDVRRRRSATTKVKD